MFDEYFSPFQIEAVTQTLEKTLNDVVATKIPATTIKITNFTSGTSYPQGMKPSHALLMIATSMVMLETGEIQVGIEWIPVGAEISLNIDFLILSAISHLTLTIPLQRMHVPPRVFVYLGGLNLKANVWFPTKPPYDVHISLVEMPQLIYPIDVKFGLLPLPNPMAFEGVKDAIKNKLQVIARACFLVVSRDRRPRGHVLWHRACLFSLSISVALSGMSRHLFLHSHA